MSERQRTQRLFVALWPADQLRQDVDSETRSVVRMCGGRVIPIENFHITLVFLGSTPQSRVADVIAGVRTIKVTPFELILGALKWWRRQELLCLEPIAGAEALANLVGDLQAVLRDKDFAVESRKFRAHLTLAREVRCAPAVKSIKALHWQVNRMEVVESQTLPTGSVYSVLAT